MRTRIDEILVFLLPGGYDFLGSFEPERQEVVDQIPIIKTSKFLATGQDDEQCEALRGGLGHYGLVFILDERVEPGLPVQYRNVMQEVFRLPPEVKAKYIQPKLSDGRQLYENGWRPPFTETPRRRDEVLHLIPDTDKPHEPPPADPKERWMRPCGVIRAKTDYPMIDHRAPITVAEVEGFETISNAWAETMCAVVMTMAEMLAIGFGERRELFTEYLAEGAHRLAPTGLDLRKHGAPGTVAAGFHNDLAAFTLHGRSNYPGLWAWDRHFRKYAVRLPGEEYLLMQVGRVLEHLTAGELMRGYHEVVMGEGPPNVDWRVTTTSFWNIASERLVEPVGSFASLPSAESYFAQSERSGERMMRTMLGKTTAPVV